MTDRISPEKISALIYDPEIKAKVFESIPSTSSLLRELALKGAPEGTLIISESQTQGRGRKGKSFFSPGDTGVYFSLLLRPKTELSAGEVTTAAAVAAARAIEAICGKKAQIKWVNDIYIGRKKVCGILTEASLSPDSGSIQFIIVGIGINLYEPEGGFPAEIRDRAGAVTETITPGLKNRLIAETVNSFYKIYRENLFETVMKEYIKRSFIIGEKITVIAENGEKEATALSINQSGNLLVRFENGEEKLLSSGEISIKLN